MHNVHLCGASNTNDNKQEMGIQSKYNTNVVLGKKCHHATMIFNNSSSPASSAPV